MDEEVADGPNLGSRAVRGSLWNFAGTGVQGLGQIFSVALLARLLTPEEYGVATAAFLAISLLTVVAQLGIVPAVIQKPSVSQADIASAAWTVTLISIVLAGAVAVFTPTINGIVGLNPGERALTLLALQLPLLGAGAVSLALLQRDLAFRTVIMIDTFAFLIGTVGTSIVLALLGFGPYSIILGNVGTAAFQTIGYRCMRAHSWSIPDLDTYAASIKVLLRYGVAISIGNLGAWLAVNGDKFVIASRLSTASLGIYGRAFQLLISAADLVGGVVDRVLFPTFSRMQYDRDRIRIGFIKSATVVTLLTALGAVLVWWNSADIVRILFGPGWQAMELPLKILAVAVLPRASFRLSDSLIRAIGRVSGAAALQWLYSAEVLLGALIGVTWGISGVAVGTTIAVFLHHLALLIYANRWVPGILREMIFMYARYLILVLPVNAIGFAASRWASDFGIVVRICVVTLAICVVTAALVALFRSIFATEVRSLQKISSVVLDRRG